MANGGGEQASEALPPSYYVEVERELVRLKAESQGQRDVAPAPAIPQAYRELPPVDRPQRAVGVQSTLEQPGVGRLRAFARALAGAHAAAQGRDARRAGAGPGTGAQGGEPGRAGPAPAGAGARGDRGARALAAAPGHGRSALLQRGAAPGPAPDGAHRAAQLQVQRRVRAGVRGVLRRDEPLLQWLERGGDRKRRALRAGAGRARGRLGRPGPAGGRPAHAGAAGHAVRREAAGRGRPDRLGAGHPRRPGIGAGRGAGFPVRPLGPGAGARAARRRRQADRPARLPRGRLRPAVERQARSHAAAAGAAVRAAAAPCWASCARAWPPSDTSRRPTRHSSRP